jgi:hypothetical protein
MAAGSDTVRAALLGIVLSLPAAAQAEIDTEHLFAFMIGSDVGNTGEREFQTQLAGRFGKGGGRYRGVFQEFEVEFVPVPNFRVELGSTFAAHDIGDVPGLDNRRQFAWEGLSLDLRYRLLERDVAPFGLTLAVQADADRIDETSAMRGRGYGAELTVALDRELIPDRLLAAVNVSYQPDWMRLADTGMTERESTLGVALAVMARARPGLLVGFEGRYLRRHEGFGLDDLAGQALFVGPTAYLKLSEQSRLTAAWSVQVWGHGSGSAAALDLVNFERHQARIIYGVNF